MRPPLGSFLQLKIGNFCGKKNWSFLRMLSRRDVKGKIASWQWHELVTLYAYAKNWASFGEIFVREVFVILFLFFCDFFRRTIVLQDLGRTNAELAIIIARDCISLQVYKILGFYCEFFKELSPRNKHNLRLNKLWNSCEKTGDYYFSKELIDVEEARDETQL